jgi:hypothetical protein
MTYPGTVTVTVIRESDYGWQSKDNMTEQIVTSIRIDSRSSNRCKTYQDKNRNFLPLR